MFFRQRVTLQRRTTWSCTALEYLSARQREHVGSDSLSLMPCAPSTRRGIKTMPSRRFLPPPDVRPRLSPEAVHYSIFRVHPYAVQREKTCPRGKPVCSKAKLDELFTFQSVICASLGLQRRHLAPALHNSAASNVQVPLDD